MRARGAGTSPVVPGQTLVLLLLAAATLAPSLLGRAGFQILEDAVAAQIFALHRHGVPGEVEYIAEHGEPAPFVHAHCHRSQEAPQERTPAELSVAATLLAPYYCALSSSLPAAPAGRALPAAPPSPRPLGFSARPLLPPPQDALPAA